MVKIDVFKTSLNKRYEGLLKYFFYYENRFDIFTTGSPYRRNLNYKNIIKSL